MDTMQTILKIIPISVFIVTVFISIISKYHVISCHNLRIVCISIEKK